MTAETLAAAIFSVLVSLLPPDRSAALHSRQYPGSAETAQVRLERYGAIARDLADVSLERAASREELRAASLLVAVAVRESGLDPDVDAQRCSTERIAGRGANCDGGKSGTIFQLREAPETRERAARRSLRGMLGSYRRCAAMPPRERLGGWFLGGRCDDPRGRALSLDREALAERVEGMLRVALRAK